MIRMLSMDLLDQDLQDINASVTRMLSLVRESCDLAKHALIDADTQAAELCVANDAKIDDLQAHLEQRILTVIARRQPAASDLRFLGSAFQSLADIERAGDYATHVARAGSELAKQPPIKRYLDLERVLEILDTMIETTINALVDPKVEIAREALEMDNEIDELYDQFVRELLTFMLEDPQKLTSALQLLNVARFLERIGDHLENVNEHIIFWLTGERL
ncbi:MAG: phosphate signaling complex protein PhoU [Trueperaceae bacterium]|nr:MAG: phosphate signaling complex protein PhoU [Trueperaceae bacterium]